MTTLKRPSFHPLCHSESMLEIDEDDEQVNSIKLDTRFFIPDLEDDEDEEEPCAKRHASYDEEEEDEGPNVRNVGLPGDAVLGYTYKSVDDAVEALNRDSKRFGVEFWLKRRSRVKKTASERIYMCCSKYKDTRYRCRAACYFNFFPASNECLFDARASILNHDHGLLVFAPSRKQREEQINIPLAIAEDVKVENPEQIRIRLSGQYAVEKLPQGMRGVHPSGGGGSDSVSYIFNELVLASGSGPRTGYRLNRCTRSRVYHRVESIGSSEDFRQVLCEEDINYFNWWLHGRPRKHHTEYVKVIGMSPCELQLSFTFIQQNSGVLDGGLVDNTGSQRYVIFKTRDPETRKTETLLAIDGNSLRAYRLHCAIHHTAVGSSMPLAPLMIQAWAAECDHDPSLRKLAMKTIIDFIVARIYEQRYYVNGSGRGYFDINHPGFQIYDYLPEFLEFFYNDDLDMDVQTVIPVALAGRDTDNIYAWIGSFILQEDVHFIYQDDVRIIHHLFAPTSKYGPALRAKYPYAFCVIDYLYDRSNGEILLNVEIPIHAFHGMAMPPVKFPPHFYLFQLCFDDEELIDYKMRHHIAMAIKIGMPYKQLVPKPPKSTLREEVVEVRAHFSRYEEVFPRPSDEAERLGLEPFSTCCSELISLHPLYRLLRGMDGLRHELDFDPIYVDDILYPDFSLAKQASRTGTLYINDPVVFATNIKNLPVSFPRQWERNKLAAKGGLGGEPVKRRGYKYRVPREKRELDLAYFEDTIWAWPLAAELEIQPMSISELDALETIILVRDARYYFEYHQNLRLVAKQQQQQQQRQHQKQQEYI